MDEQSSNKAVPEASADEVQLKMDQTPADQQHPASHSGLQSEIRQGRLSWIDLTARRLSERLERADGRGTWLKIRYLVVFCCFLANAVGYLMRVNLSVAIVAMTVENSTGVEGPENVPHYDWDETVRGTILSSFFWGYIVTQVPSGYIASRFSATKLLFFMMLAGTAATLLFPTAAEWGWEWACVARVILGLAQGSLLPCTHALLAKWSPPSERGRMSVYAYTGQPFGTVVAMSCSGLIAASAGWPWVFYATGAIGLFASALWILLAADSPATHKLTSQDERSYIESSIGIKPITDSSQRLRTPWKAILTSVPMWALIVVHCAQNWGFWTLLTEIPSYMDGVLGFNLKANGLLSALPYLGLWAFGLIISWVSDTLLKKNCYSIGTSRKIGNSIAHYGGAVGLVALGFMSASQAGAVGVLIVAVSLNAGTMVGYQVNHIDLSPNFASTMMGITNCLGNFMSILGPLVVGFIVTDKHDAEQWRIVWLISAAIYVVGNSVFVIFGSGETQPWNSADYLQAKAASVQDSSSDRSSSPQPTEKL
ncbi:putative inorganic phosphate cotransporter isoform X2 [Neocloeon triangulifer]|nr:putative inorganic phosphate cotransporter isoform X2 [Neocloeon triangulifer]